MPFLNALLYGGIAFILVSLTRKARAA
jgi:hypothetical protein